MSTRGAFGFHENGRDKLYYNHYDSYPEGLGAELINYIKTGKSKELEEIMADKRNLRNNFIYDSLFCEYAYILNLDEDVLEVYVGFQKQPPKGRYSDATPIKHCDGDDWYACGLVTTIHIDTIKRYPTEKIVQMITEDIDEEESANEI